MRRKVRERRLRSHAVSTPVLGIVGKGPLGRRLQQVAGRLGLEAHLFDGVDDLTDGGAPKVDVLTVTIAAVDPAAVLACERQGIAVRPGASTLAMTEDRVAMRRLISSVGAPVPPWRQPTDEAELRAALTSWPAVVMKSARAGRYRTGVEFPTTPLEGFRSGVASLREGQQLLVEPLLTLDMELAVAVARRPNGDTVTYPPVRSVQWSGRSREVVSPAGVDDTVTQQASAVATQVANRLGVVGVLVVELFLSGGELMVNEVIARPHHAAQHAEYAFATSQTENHLRAVLDLPLGAVDPVPGSAVMVNVLGNAAGNDPRHHLAEALARDPLAKVELLGEAHRFDRLLGHVVVTDTDEVRARSRAWQTVVALRGDLAPVRPMVGGR